MGYCRFINAFPQEVQRASGVLVRACLLTMVLAPIQPAGAQPRQAESQFKTGDRVEAQSAGKWKMGEVIEVMRNGFVKVRFLESRDERSLPPRWVRAGGAESFRTSPAPDRTSPETERLPRVWADKTGQFKVEATLVEFKDGQVSLRRTDGTVVTLPLERLSKADQDYVTKTSGEGSHSPEAVLRQFLVAMTLGDRETGKTLLRPNPTNQILWQGTPPPSEAAEEVKQHFQELELRRLTVGEKVTLPGGKVLVVDESEVNAGRVLIAAADAPLPFVLVRLEGLWKVDAKPIIAARTAAFSARKNAALERTASPPGTGTGDAESPEDADGWQTLTVENGRFRVMMPGQPKVEERVVQSQYGPVVFRSHKVARHGVFWNLMVITYPPAAVGANADPLTFLKNLAEANEKQKKGAQRDYLRELEGSDYWSIEHRFRYPSGNNAEGATYPAGVALHRHHLVETSDCWLFVDISDSAYQASAKQIDVQVNRFFSSLEIVGK